MVTSTETFWDGLYRSRRSWGGRPNPLLAEVAGSLTPGSAMDLGCGAGGDTIWLARRGWRVTAVDVSAVAISGVRAHAATLNLTHLITTTQHDLATGLPPLAEDETFELISAQYLHTPLDLDRGRLLREAARFLSPGGLLLVVDHGSIAPWSWNQDPGTHFPTPAEVAAGIALDPAEWAVLRADMPRRQATGPGGQTAMVTDNVLLIQRTVRRPVHRSVPAAIHPAVHSAEGAE